MEELIELGLIFDNSYVKLDKRLYKEVHPTKVEKPKLTIYNENLGEKLGIRENDKNKLTLGLSGKNLISGSIPIALAYAGHQFGHFNILGDGRANLLGEILVGEKRFDIQLKGSGPTFYSRRGDGRGTLSAMLREYLISEAMFYLGIPTTRSLAVVETSEEVYREKVEKGAVLTRVAKSHIRVGTFEYVAYLDDLNLLKNYTDYVIQREFSEITHEEKKYEIFLETVAKRQMELIIEWIRVGFIHGVMNTDNTSISCETIDYGPCAFLNNYNPKKVYSSIDHYGRYSFENQKKVIIWNLVKFAQTLLPIIHEDEESAIFIAQRIIDKTKVYGDKLYNGMLCKKIGLSYTEENLNIALSFLKILEKYQLDYTNSFIILEKYLEGESYVNEAHELTQWLKKWKTLVSLNETEKTKEILRNTNPKVIPRNHMVEKALKNAVEGDMSLFEKILDILKTPYKANDELNELNDMPYDEREYKTYCGT